MNMKRPAGTLLKGGGVLPGILLSILVSILVIQAVAVALAQSNGGQTAAASKEWPTYGHDAGGMRFSPLTQITPANVSQLKVAWVYHMRPAGAVTTAGRGAAGVVPPDVAPAGRGPGGAEGETPPPPQGGRGRGRFG